MRRSACGDGKGQITASHFLLPWCSWHLESLTYSGALVNSKRHGFQFPITQMRMAYSRDVYVRGYDLSLTFRPELDRATPV
jgi:hypothetical protein